MTARTDDRDARRAEAALNRFGLGARPGDLKRVASDPRGAIEAELARPGVALLSDPYLRSTQQSAFAYLERKTLLGLRNGKTIRGRRELYADMMRKSGRLPEGEPPVEPAKADGDMGGMDADMAGGMDGGGMADDAAAAKARTLEARKRFFPEPPTNPAKGEIAARFARFRTCEIGFVERLVQFWTNHFTVSAKGALFVGWIAGAYEREAIRPHVFGRFTDMLSAAIHHPAMLRYLDNEVSAGPNSRLGRRRRKGLNENLARELLELHTVGVSGGYAQADVIALAKALTGWRIEKDPERHDFGLFAFEDRAHEPGDQTVMGKVYPEGEREQAEAILADLARHPSTATHVARRMATSFVADEPPQPLVEKLARTFRDTDGDLREMALALVASDEAWDAPRAKMRSPQEFLFAAARAIDRTPDTELVVRALQALGQPFWTPPSPKGFSLIGRDWIAPDAQTNRLDLAVDLAEAHARDVDPVALAADVIAAPSDETMTAVRRAGSREQALALLLMSPEMQRR